MEVYLPRVKLGLEKDASSISQPGGVGVKDGSVLDKVNKEEAALFALSREIVQASDWDGDLESRLCVIKCLTSSLSLNDNPSKKRKL
jgi:hypothetical protein